MSGSVASRPRRRRSTATDVPPSGSRRAPAVDGLGVSRALESSRRGVRRAASPLGSARGSPRSPSDLPRLARRPAAVSSSRCPQCCCEGRTGLPPSDRVDERVRDLDRRPELARPSAGDRARRARDRGSCGPALVLPPPGARVSSTAFAAHSAASSGRSAWNAISERATASRRVSHRVQPVASEASAQSAGQSAWARPMSPASSAVWRRSESAKRRGMPKERSRDASSASSFEARAAARIRSRVSSRGVSLPPRPAARSARPPGAAKRCSRRPRSRARRRHPRGSR